VWSDDDWKSTKKSDASSIGALDLWFADFPTKTLPTSFVIEFTFFWKNEQRWEGSNYSIAVSGPK
jgi:glucoamylase